MSNDHRASFETQASEAMRDALAGWRYIRQSHGDLYGVGWDRVEQKLEAALASAQAASAEPVAPYGYVIRALCRFYTDKAEADRDARLTYHSPGGSWFVAPVYTTPAPAASAEPVARGMQIDLDEQATKLLLDYANATDEPNALSLSVGHGHSGYGLYMWETECANEGAVLLQAIERPMVDIVPPATSRDRWMYEQGRLAERDPRTTPAPAVAPAAVTETAPKRDHWRGGHSYEAGMLRDLLAVIHRDGGHYVEQYGLDRAIEDARVKVASRMSALEVGVGFPLQSLAASPTPDEQRAQAAQEDVQRGILLGNIIALVYGWKDAEKARFECERYINTVEDEPEDRERLKELSAAARTAWANLEDALRAALAGRSK